VRPDNCRGRARLIREGLAWDDLRERLVTVGMGVNPISAKQRKFVETQLGVWKHRNQQAGREPA
jgi:hypothetical protein